MKELEKKYNHLEVEKNKYDKWMNEKIFESENDSLKKKFSIIIPPPNVTGKLHLGHAWDGSIQDFLIRFKKINGYDTVWIPGMDHAGIATQVKVEQRLKEQGINKNEIGRESFILKAQEWKEEYASTIRSQWKKMGLGLDYTKEVFTLSDDLQKLVTNIFVNMYNNGLIYKGKKIVNWDVKQQTAISNIEVIYKETKGNFYFFKYFLEDKSDFLTIATTRPETMYGDVCVVVNPNDDRYKKYIGKKVINPVNGDLLPLIADDYVEIDFGTGVMKCTPAHDFNDYEIGKKYNFASPICMNEDGTLNELAGSLNGVERFEARKKIIEFTTKDKTFIKSEEITHQVGYSERSNVVIEPYLSEQWFVKMDGFAKDILKNQSDSNLKTKFYPERFNDTLKTWMNGVHDWTISRQLWWGHRIPAWYNKKTKEMYVGTSAPKDYENWIQDEDVLDTWFSSGLWPFAAFGYDFEKTLEEQNDFFKSFFPSSVLVTGYDIIFFWVARMMFQTYNTTKTKAFENVLIHGLIRDEQGRKMSKSLGNGIDPMTVIEENGADSLRYFLLTNSSPGLDLRYSTEKISSSWNFINKIWNASRYVLMSIDDDFIFDVNFNKNIEIEKIPTVNKWILNKLTKVANEVKNNIDKFEFTIAGKILYDFVWNDFCSWYIELSKINLKVNDEELVKHTKNTLHYVLKNILVMLHPFMPFVTEEIYGYLNLKSSILKERWLTDSFNYDVDFLDEVIVITESIREFRIKNDIKKNISLSFQPFLENSKYKEVIFNNLKELNLFLVSLCNSNLNGDQINDAFELVIKDYSLKIEKTDFISKEKSNQIYLEKLDAIKKEIERSEKILNNDNFLKKASVEKVDEEKRKYNEYKNQYKKLLDSNK